MKLMKVTVFGGSQPQPGSFTYKEAYELGKMLASTGHGVITGGYIGTMEAVSKGAAEAGGHVIGVTCSEIETWRPIKPNRWIQEERRFPTLFERLRELIQAGDAAIALPGGPGTLTEVALMWNLMIIGASPVKPLIMFGKGWKSVIKSFYSSFNDFIPKKQRSYLSFAKDITEAISILNTTKY